ncbi:Opsin-1 [Neolecta irregularis DAH-3]|uniref:Opsin-1 n=1 Tax=Neolecta irregularis (strain DAH-3) TaxID=1198029 RepID=A0A1U7LLQ3_NEOID|nr:Opsin-1 [Neolecta irregularis DAH-3]|eukprot:OLL23590.1 Opsin-1 [Neolecta irregularis DAH-3]
MAAFLYIVHHLVFIARSSARLIGKDVHRLFIGIAIWTAMIWSSYPIAWGLSQAENTTIPHNKTVFYDILDLLAKPVFGFWIILGHRGVGIERLGLVERRSHPPEHTASSRDFSLSVNQPPLQKTNVQLVLVE